MLLLAKRVPKPNLFVAALHHLDAGADACQVIVLVPSAVHAKSHAHLFQVMARAAGLTGGYTEQWRGATDRQQTLEGLCQVLR